MTIIKCISSLNCDVQKNINGGCINGNSSLSMSRNNNSGIFLGIISTFVGLFGGIFYGVTQGAASGLKSGSLTVAENLLKKDGLLPH